MGNGRYRILAHFPCPMGLTAPVYEYSPRNFVFYPLEPRPFNTIKIWMDDDEGKRVPFTGGTSQVKVYIRQQRHH